MRKISFSSKCSQSIALSCARRLEVVAERLLDDQPRPAGRGSALAERLDDRRKRGRRNCEVIDAVSPELPLLVEPREQVFAACPRRPRPRSRSRRSACSARARSRRPRGTRRGRASAPPPSCRSGMCRRHRRCAQTPTIANARREQPPQHQRVERRHQLLVREIAGGAEDHERARIGRAPEEQPLFE